jgi:signal transduction histidine kinase
VTQRILLALLALTASLLVGAVVPLGLKATAHDRASFLDDTRATARSAAAVAEEQLADNHPDPGMASVLAAARREGDDLLVVNAGGHVVTATGAHRPAWQGLIGEATEHAEPVTEVAGERVIVVVPVRDTGPVVGTVVLARSTEPMTDGIHRLWLSLAGIGGAALAAAALIAITLARWVGRPLATLDGTARKLADGNLAVRARTSSGPPELRRLATTFNTMAGRLETLVHGHRAVVADVSHQLRTPLAALRLRIDLLADDAGPETADELADARDELARLSRLVDGMLAVARAENVVPQPVPVVLGEVAGERVAAWRPVADDRGIELTARTNGHAAVLLGDGHLEQILDNLLANALDAAGEGNHVAVTASAAPDGARLVVSDDGPGMSPEDRDRAFLRFVTASPNGTGLGLAIVHRLVTSNGGTARLAETDGGGLSVVMDFPAAAGVNGGARPGSGAKAKEAPS